MDTLGLLTKLYPDKRLRELQSIAPHIESYYRQQQIQQHIYSYIPRKELSKWKQIIGLLHSLKESLVSYSNLLRKKLIKPYWWIRLQLQRRRKQLKELQEVKTNQILLGGKPYTMLEIANLWTSTNNRLDLVILDLSNHLLTHQKQNCSVCGLILGQYYDRKNPGQHWLCTLSLNDGYTKEYIRDCSSRLKPLKVKKTFDPYFDKTLSETFYINEGKEL